MKRSLHKKRLIQDLEALQKDWRALIKNQKLSRSTTYLKKLAKHLLQLQKDAKSVQQREQIFPYAEKIQHLINTPWGAPFVSETNLIDAARHFEARRVEETALAHIMQGFVNYGKNYETQVFGMLEEILEDLSGAA